MVSGMTESEYIEVPAWFLELCPKNLDAEVCAKFVQSPKWHWAEDSNGRFIFNSKGRLYSIAEQYFYRCDSLAKAWHASAEKEYREKDEKFKHHYKDVPDEKGIYHWSEDYFGEMPDEVYKKLCAHINALKSELDPLVPDFERWSWERISDNYPKMPPVQVDCIIKYLTSVPVEIIHYVGSVDDMLTKMIMENGRYKLTVMDMYNKYETGFGYHFDKDLNMIYFGRPPWLYNKVGFYSEGGPRKADVWIRDFKWDSTTQLDILLTKYRFRCPLHLILIGEAIADGLHPYYDWNQDEGIYFGVLQDKHVPHIEKGAIVREDEQKPS